jgi:hypothetical protein
MSIKDTVARIKDAGEAPRSVAHGDGETAFSLRSRVVLRDKPSQPGADWRFPADLDWLWRHTEEVRLFEDIQYGQWGLVILNHEAAVHRTLQERARRPSDLLPGDVIVAEFLGDSDLLVVRADPETEDFGSVLVALPIDRRRHWPAVGESLSAFLDRYVSAQGAKYWEA